MLSQRKRMDFKTAESHLQALEQYGESIGLDDAYLSKLRHFSLALREKDMEKTDSPTLLEKVFQELRLISN
jgi:hypothetical protein